MNPELDALIQSLDAAHEARGEAAAHRWHLYESRLEDVLARHPGLRREALENAVHLAWSRRLARERKATPTLPPKA